VPEKVRKIIRAVLFVVAVIFVFWGVCRGEMKTVFVKAVNVCLECVGIG
jgi:hypothetical protein